MKAENIDTYKPHWVRRSTAVRETKKGKGKCPFDTACDIMLITYSIGVWVWIFLDAFGYFM